jgi:hypothetical protein
MAKEATVVDDISGWLSQCPIVPARRIDRIRSELSYVSMILSNVTPPHNPQGNV